MLASYTCELHLTMQSVAAHRVPPELFAWVIRNAVDGSLRHAHAKGMNSVKRELSRCSLVCSYWAKHSRASIFEFLDLFCQEDVETLLQFARTTTRGMCIATYVHYISLNVTIPEEDPPWIHLLLSPVCSIRFPVLQTFFIAASGKGVDDEQQVAGSSLEIAQPTVFTPPSLFHSLPRQLPVATITWSLTISDMHFATYTQVVTFVSTCLSSRADAAAVHLHLNSVSWADADALKPAQTPAAFQGAHRRWRRRISRVAAYDCSSGWPLIWLVATTQLFPEPQLRQILFVDSAEMRRIASLVHHILGGSESTTDGAQKEASAISIDIDDSDAHAIIVEGASHRLRLKVSLGGLVTSVDLILGDVEATQPELVSPALLRRVNWVALDACIDAFNATMERFAIRIPAHTCEETVCAQLPLTVASGRLELVRDKGTTGAEGLAAIEESV